MATLRANFASNLKRLLRERGYTQRSFAEKHGLSEANLSRWLNQMNFPGDEVIDELCGILNVTHVELLADPEETPDPFLRFLQDQAKARGYEIVKKKKQ